MVSYIPQIKISTKTSLKLIRPTHQCYSQISKQENNTEKTRKHVAHICNP